jgi:hypothetical protein
MFSTPFTFLKAVGGGGGFDPDAQDFFNRVVANGGSLSATEENAINTAVIDLKAYGIWNELKAVYPFVGGSADSCEVNLKSSSFLGTFSGSWTITSSGVSTGSLTSYFDTGFNMDSNTTISNAHYGWYCNTEETYPNALVGCYEGNASNRTFAYINLANETYPEWGDTFVNMPSTATSDVGLLLAVADSGTLSAYYRGTLDNSTSYGGGVANLNWWFGNRNDNGSPVGEPQQGRLVWGTLGNKLTATQAANYSTVVQAFQTALSRNGY